MTLGRLRLSTQFLALIIVNLGFTQALKTGIPCPVFYCYGCPWAFFACPIGAYQNFAAIGSFGALSAFPFYAIGTLGLFALALGRTWCGWACPFGTVQDLVIRVRRRDDVAHLPSLSWSKYASLIGIMVAAWLFADAVFCKVCPAGSLFAAIPHRFASADEFSFGTFFWVHLATLGAALILFVLFARFWCRYLCPLGAILGLFNRFSLVKLRLDADKCTDCGACMVHCPAGIHEAEDIGNATDCVQCTKCIDACPANAIRVSISVRN